MKKILFYFLILLILGFLSCGGSGNDGGSDGGNSQNNDEDDDTTTTDIKVIVAAGTGGASYSEDGELWKKLPAMGGLTYWCATYGDGIFIIGGNFGQIQHSVKGADLTSDWIDVQVAGNSDADILRGLAYGLGCFVAVGENSSNGYIYFSSDADNWYPATHPSCEFFYNVKFVKDRFMACSTSNNGQIYYSFDGISWDSIDLGNDNYVQDITYGNDLYIAVGSHASQPVSFTSSDGYSWTIHPMSSEYGPCQIAFGNDTFVAVGDTGGMSGNTYIWYSSDGIAWSGQNIGGVRQNAITYGKNNFIIGGDLSAIRKSSSGLPGSWISSSAESGWITAITAND